MIIKTNKDIYVGRTFIENGKCVPNPIIPDGETEPFKIPAGTEVVRLGASEHSVVRHFKDKTDFENSFEEGFYDFVLPEESYNTLWRLLDYANVILDTLEDYTFA